jgi:hypothetical protein
MRRLRVCVYELGVRDRKGREGQGDGDETIAQGP